MGRVVIEAGGYEDLSVLSFDDQTDDAPSSIKTTENAEIAEIADDHQTRTSATPERTTGPAIPAAPQRARNRPLELESSEPDGSSDSDVSDALSGRPKRATAGPVDYRALNDPWAKGHSRGRANRVQIESDTRQTVEQARASPDWEQWKLAFRSELDAHTKNDTFTLGTPPPNRRILPTRWVTTIKRGPKGKVIKLYKARWVCKGFRQEQGIDYDETFASVVSVGNGVRMLIRIPRRLVISAPAEAAWR